jgi:SAM-dependent methyltransferase
MNLQCAPGDLYYQCNICGSTMATPLATLDRETQTCTQCGSNPRFRAVIHCLSLELFGTALALPDFPVRKDLRGIGLSDWSGYAAPLTQKLAYTNTYFHTEPRLDVADTSGWHDGEYDFIISSEVFEHVAPPVTRSLENCLRLLKPGGVLVLTTPFAVGDGRTTQEHFPDLHEYTIVQRENGAHQLVNRTVTGEIQVFDNLVFHEGDGVAVEMRLFSEQSLLEDLEVAGFRAVRVRREPVFEYGIYWSNPCSWPITARRCAPTMPY